MTAVLAVPEPKLWTPDQPNQCCCGYVTQRRGRIIIREPAEAWAMLEFKHHDPQKTTLTEKMRKVCRFEYELGFQHLGDSRKSYKGYPDLHLWPLHDDQHDADGHFRHVWIELKRMRTTDRDDPSDDQILLLEQFSRMDPVYLVRPCCLLSGAVDLLLCRHFGGEPRSSHAGGDPGAVFLSQLTRDEARAAAARAEVLAPARQLPPPSDDPPGEPGLPDHVLGRATAVTVPPPGGNDAIREVEAWMRAAGFPPASTRYPLRFVIAAGIAAVEVSTGLARAGQPAPREWRWSLTRFHFPYRLAEQLGMSVSEHASVAEAAHAAEGRG